jgi:hypothetical protein
MNLLSHSTSSAFIRVYPPPSASKKNFSFFTQKSPSSFADLIRGFVFGALFAPVFVDDFFCVIRGPAIILLRSNCGYFLRSFFTQKSPILPPRSRNSRTSCVVSYSALFLHPYSWTVLFASIRHKQAAAKRHWRN